MASKLEKAQQQYEDLLIELAEKAKMLNMLDQVTPGVLAEYRKAEETLADRRLELEFLQDEIKRMDEEHRSQIEALEKQLAQAKEQLEQKQDIVKVKEDKAAPLRKKLAGFEYDYKFAEKAEKEERQKYQHAIRVDDPERARLHEENLKRMKIDLMRRLRAIDELKRQIAKFEQPSQQLGKEAEELQQLIRQLTQRLKDAREAQDSEERRELKRQCEAKEKEVNRAELLVNDTLASAGEDLYERRVEHPVLSKLYEDMDRVAKIIDELQQQAEQKK